MTKNVDVDNTMRKSPPNRLPRVSSKTLGAEPKKIKENNYDNIKSV